MSSHDAVNALRRLFGTRQVGHTGTLDPMATGVLTALVGRAVKASEYLVSDRKEYEALLQLGVTTDTEDTTGRVLSTSERLPAAQEVCDVCAQMIGAQMQVPPMYSALKIGGKKLYDLARRNIEVERQPREIFVYALDGTPIDANAGRYALSIVCSKGTYIRTICADIGKKLGCGGAMAALKRTANGAFRIEDAHTLDELAAMPPEERHKTLLPVESLFADLPALDLPAFYKKLCASGCPIYLHKIGCNLPLGARARLSYEGRFFALGEVGEYEEGPAVKALKQFVLFDKE